MRDAITQTADHFQPQVDDASGFRCVWESLVQAGQPECRVEPFGEEVRPESECQLGNHLAGGRCRKKFCLCVCHHVSHNSSQRKRRAGRGPWKHGTSVIPSRCAEVLAKRVVNAVPYGHFKPMQKAEKSL